jgi:hypothetical protein
LLAIEKQRLYEECAAVQGVMMMMMITMMINLTTTMPTLLFLQAMLDDPFADPTLRWHSVLLSLGNGLFDVTRSGASLRLNFNRRSSIRSSAIVSQFATLKKLSLLCPFSLQAPPTSARSRQSNCETPPASLHWQLPPRL